MAIEKDFFRQVMGHFPTGVTVVTTSHLGVPAGLTVSSFVSLSLDPPLVLICVDNSSHTLEAFRESKAFAINFLRQDQSYLSRCFALPSQERFEHFCYVPYHTAVTGSPVIDECLAFVDTRLEAEYPGGDHVIFIGRIEAMGTADQVVFADDDGRARSTLTHYHDYEPGKNGNSLPVEPLPLAYYRGRYRHLAAAYNEPSLLPKTQEMPVLSANSDDEPYTEPLSPPETRTSDSLPQSGQK